MFGSWFQLCKKRANMMKMVKYDLFTGDYGIHIRFETVLKEGKLCSFLHKIVDLFS
jgi:hypothetical protein